MPKVQNLDKVWMFMHAVEDQNWCVHKLTDTRPLSHRASYVRKVFEQVNVIQDGIAKLLRSGRKIVPGVGDDFLKIS